MKNRRMWLAAGVLPALAVARERGPKAAEERDPAVGWSGGRADHSSDDVPADWAKTPVIGVKLEERRVELVADFWFRARAPQGLVVTANGKRGYFPIRPVQAPDLDERQCNAVLRYLAGAGRDRQSGGER